MGIPIYEWTHIDLFSISPCVYFLPPSPSLLSYIGLARLGPEAGARQVHSAPGGPFSSLYATAAAQVGRETSVDSG